MVDFAVFASFIFTSFSVLSPDGPGCKRVWTAVQSSTERKMHHRETIEVYHLLGQLRQRKLQDCPPPPCALFACVGTSNVCTG